MTLFTFPVGTHKFGFRSARVPKPARIRRHSPLPLLLLVNITHPRLATWMMTLIVPSRSQSFTPPLASLGVPLSLLLGDTVGDGRPWLPKRYGLDRLPLVVQQQITSEARSHPLSTGFFWLNVFLRW